MSVKKLAPSLGKRKWLACGATIALASLSTTGTAFAAPEPGNNADASTPTVAGEVTGKADSAEKNLVETRNFTNSDLSVLPDNANWQGDQSRHQSIVDRFDDSVSAPTDPVPYSIYDTRPFPGFKTPDNKNAKEFGWTIDGAVSLSKTGKAYKEGTGADGVVNPENKKNIIWLGKYAPKGDINTITTKEYIAREHINNADKMPKDTTFEYVTGTYCKVKRNKWGWDLCQKNGKPNSLVDQNETATFVDPNTDENVNGIGIYRVGVKATFPDTTYWILGTRVNSLPKFNMGIRQAVDVTPGSEIVVTPSWVSNGKTGGIDQIGTLLYDATGKTIADFPRWWMANERLQPKATAVTDLATAGTQGFVWKVPEGVTRLFVGFNTANSRQDHTGLENKKAIALSGFTGATITSGSHLKLSLSEKNNLAKQIATKDFDFTLDLTSDGHAPVRAGEFTTALPKGVTAKSVELVIDGKSYPGKIESGKVVVPIPKMDPKATAQIIFHNVNAVSADAWKLNGTELSYDTFAENGGYLAGKPADGKAFHLNFAHDVLINVLALPVSDEPTQPEEQKTTPEKQQPTPEKQQPTPGEKPAPAAPEQNVAPKAEQKQTKPAGTVTEKRVIVKKSTPKVENKQAQTSEALASTGVAPVAALAVAGTLLALGVALKKRHI